MTVVDLRVIIREGEIPSLFLCIQRRKGDMRLGGYI